MARPCSVCAHPRRQEIDVALISGESFRNIAERFGTSPAALHRHKAHVAGQVAQAQEARKEQGKAHGLTLLQRLQSLEAEARAVLQEAKEAGDHVLRLKALDSLRRALETVGKYSPVSLQLPRVGSAQETAKAMSAVVEAAACGKITPQEGQTLGGLLELHRKMVETAELEARIVALEAREAKK